MSPGKGRAVLADLIAAGRPIPQRVLTRIRPEFEGTPENPKFKCECGRLQHIDMVQVDPSGEAKCDGCLETERRNGN